MSRKSAPKEDDLAWVFDSLVDFLRGPVWNLPIITFIELKSVTFGADGEHRKGYKAIHDDYKNLVDFMLGSYMEDICITPHQFETACRRSAQQLKSKFHQALFEQLWAADDYDMFERMMTRTNIELQLQALQLIKHRLGIVPSSFVPGGEDAASSEKRVMESVIAQSVKDYKQDEARMSRESKDLEKALASSSKDAKQKPPAARDAEQQLSQDMMKLAVSEATTSAANGGQISAEEIEKRQKYLRDQRDKLLSMKKNEREKLLVTKTEEEDKRPKSSRAARSALAGKVDSKSLEARKVLAQILKRDVVDKK